MLTDELPERDENIKSILIESGFDKTKDDVGLQIRAEGEYLVDGRIIIKTSDGQLIKLTPWRAHEVGERLIKMAEGFVMIEDGKTEG